VDEAVATVDEVAPETAPAQPRDGARPPLLIAVHRGDLEQARAMIEEFDRREADGGAAFESDYRSVRGWRWPISTVLLWRPAPVIDPPVGD